MGTSPTVLASTPSAPVPASTAPAKFPVIPLLICVLAGTLIASLCLGGVVFYLIRSGRIPCVRGEAVKAAAPSTMTTHAIVLEPMLVNLADAGGSSYLRVALTLRVVDAGDKNDGAAKNAKRSSEEKGSGDLVASVRDTSLTVLGDQTAEELMSVDGKEHLKEKLKSAFAEHNSEVKVIDVFFTDFLVQR